VADCVGAYMTAARQEEDMSHTAKPTLSELIPVGAQVSSSTVADAALALIEAIVSRADCLATYCSLLARV
jgi:hypothetical protein